MQTKILLVSENQEDLKVLKLVLGTDQFYITQSSFKKDIASIILEKGFHLILADYDLIHDSADLFFDIQKDKSGLCIIFYGEKISSDDVSQVLQKGIYTVIPRALLSERARDAVIGGLENRKAFIEIIGMVDKLKKVNGKLNKEKDTLKKKNRELGFINRLSSEVAYDLNWDRILPRILEIGLTEILDYSLFGIFFKIRSHWDLALHLREGGIEIDEDNLKTEI